MKYALALVLILTASPAVAQMTLYDRVVREQQQDAWERATRESAYDRQVQGERNRQLEINIDAARQQRENYGQPYQSYSGPSSSSSHVYYNGVCISINCD